MPRVSREQTAVNRNAITAASARLMRERGIDGVSVADLMHAAGLTHGGFYGHFDSKDSLAAAACAHAFDHSVQRWRKRIDEHADKADALMAVIAGFLSVTSRDHPGTACPATGLAGDVAREPAGAPVRSAYRDGVKALLEILTSLQTGGSDAAMRTQALTQLATMLGALLLARATAGDGLSDEFLQSARDALSRPTRPAAVVRRSPRSALRR